METIASADGLKLQLLQTLFLLMIEPLYSTVDLLTFESNSSDASQFPCCKDPHIKSCLETSLNVSLIPGYTDIRLPVSQGDFFFSDWIEPNGYIYKSTNGDLATFSLNKETSRLYGSLQTEDRAFVLEPCNGGHVWIEYDVESIEDEEYDEWEKGVLKYNQTDDDLLPRVDPPEADTTTVYEFSVMVYYTPEFAAITTDIPDFVNTALADTNKGYKNSNLPMRVKLHCIEAATFKEAGDNVGNLERFLAMKKDEKELRNSADTAMLLTVSGSGIARNINVIGTGQTVAVAAKANVQTIHTFAHELALLAGCWHNREAHGGTRNKYFDFAHGHLIEKGEANSGFRSIMGYPASGHQKRVNYYSSPNIIYPDSGTATGRESSDNQRLLMMNRQALSKIGDESSICKITGTGQNSDWDFCSFSEPCMRGQGDCDSNSECKDNLVCGRNNCREFHARANRLADCCITPPEYSETENGHNIDRNDGEPNHKNKQAPKKNINKNSYGYTETEVETNVDESNYNVSAAIKKTDKNYEESTGTKYNDKVSTNSEKGQDIDDTNMMGDKSENKQNDIEKIEGVTGLANKQEVQVIRQPKANSDNMKAAFTTFLLLPLNSSAEKYKRTPFDASSFPTFFTSAKESFGSSRGSSGGSAYHSVAAPVAVPAHPVYPPPSYPKQPEPSHNCSIQHETATAQVCVPALANPECGSVTVKGVKVSQKEQCLSITKTVCTVENEEVTSEVCLINYVTEKETAEATLVEVTFSKECSKQMVTVCQPVQAYPHQQNYGQSQGYGYKKESHQKCEEIAQETCYNKPGTAPKKEQVSVSVPTPRMECAPQKFSIPSVKCQEVSEERCVSVPSLEPSDVQAEQCTVKLGQQACQQVSLTLPLQVCREQVYGSASKPVAAPSYPAAAPSHPGPAPTKGYNV